MAGPVMDDNLFESEARKADRTSLIVEFWRFLKENKKWWLLPIILVLVLIGALLLMTATGVGPFIYTLF
jgi:hypothetical protein